MLTGKPQKNRGAATTYFDEHLSHNDYYSQAETQAGHWIGVGAEKLGLKADEIVTREAFLRLCDNLHPESGKQLTQVTAKARRIFFDFQCAPPKSVSILAVTMDDRRIIQAHKEASTIALRELEKFDDQEDDAGADLPEDYDYSGPRRRWSDDASGTE